MEIVKPGFKIKWGADEEALINTLQQRTSDEKFIEKVIGELAGLKQEKSELANIALVSQVVKETRRLLVNEITEITKDRVLKQIEEAARNCTKTDYLIKEGSCYPMARQLVEYAHGSMLEFAGITVLIRTDRIVSHQLVRHRPVSYAQESQRYCSYIKERFGKKVGFVKPVTMPEGSVEFKVWERLCEQSEHAYLELLGLGVKAEQARSVLTNSAKTDIMVKTNVREWRHIFQLRAVDVHPDPQMRQIMIPLLLNMAKRVPVVFADLIPQDLVFWQKDNTPYPKDWYAEEL